MNKNINIPSALTQYAADHRDERNVILHGICLPLFLLAVTFLVNMLLASWTLWSSLILGWTLFLIMAFCYIWSFGLLGLTGSLAVAFISLVGYTLAQCLNPLNTLLTSVTLLIAAYLLHRLGHWYEGHNLQRPYKLVMLAVAPLYIIARKLHQHTYFNQICKTLDVQAGPIYIRDIANPN